MPLPCLLKEQICYHLLPLWLEGIPPLLPPKKLEQPFALSRPNPIANIPELNDIAASYIVKIILMSMPKSIYSKLYFDKLFGWPQWWFQTHPMESRNPKTNMDMLPAQLFC